MASRRSRLRATKHAHTLAIGEWPEEWSALRGVFDQALRQAGLAPCLPDRARLSARLDDFGGDASAYAARCREEPLARLGLLDLVPRPCAHGWIADAAPYDDFEQRLLPRLARQRQAVRPMVRAWCMAACRGEGAWRVAQAMLRALPEREHWDAAVLATDFSLVVLTAAQVGRYRSEESRLGAAERRQLLVRSRSGGWAVRPELRRLVHFAWLDPADDWPAQGPFEAIFTGDLLGLLAPPARAAAIARIARLLRRRGTLYCDPSDDFPELVSRFPRQRAPGIRTR